MSLGHLLMIPGLGATAAAPLNILASVGTSLTPTTTGNVAVTGVGFQPKLVMPFTALQPVSQSTAGANTTFGFANAISSASMSGSTQSGLTTSNAWRRLNSKALCALGSDGLVFTEATLSSLDANGFTLNYSATQLTQMILNHICIGGADVEISVTQQRMNSTYAPQSFAHGLSGLPTALIALTISDSTAFANQTVGLLNSYGIWANGQQRSLNLWSQNGVTTTVSKKALTTEFITQGTTTVLRNMSVSSVDATNVNVTYSSSGASLQMYFALVAIRGAKCQVGSFDCNGSLDPLTISTPGIIPKLFLGFALAECVDNINTVRDHINFSIFASDGTNNVSCGMTDLNNVTTTVSYRHQLSNALQEVTAVDGAQRFSATASFSGQSVLLDPTVNQGTSWGQGAYIVIGA